MTDKWKKGAVTFHGWAGHDFPNFMVISPLQAGGTPNYTHNASEMAMHLVHIMDEVKKRNIKSMEPTVEAEQAWVKAVVETQGARADLDQVKRVTSTDPNDIYNLGVDRANLGDKQGAIADFQKAAELYRQQGKTSDYQKMQDLIRKLQQ